MNNTQLQSFVARLLKAKTSEDVDNILGTETQGMAWESFGRDPSNQKDIQVASDPIRAEVERNTNGIDSVIERAVIESGINPSTLNSPLEAVNRLFPDPESRRQKVLIQIDPRGGVRSSNVTNMDYGTGIDPEDWKKTILGFGGNKDGKRYLVGKYGWGGAASIGMVDTRNGYVIIISRTATSAVGFTVIRYHAPLDETKAKRGWYEYLVDANGKIPFATGIKLPETPKKIKVPEAIGEFPQGTMVRHINYNLSAYPGIYKKDQNGCWFAFNAYQFRPLLPIHIDLVHKESKSKRAKKLAEKENRQVGEEWINDPRVIQGAGTMLDRLASEDDPNKDKAVEFASGTVTIPIELNGKKEGTISLAYWVQSNVDSKKRRFHLPHPNRCVLGVFMGQTQDERTLEDLSNKIKEAFPRICGNGRNDLVIEIRVDGLSRYAMDDLLASTRESFKNSECLTQIRKAVTKVVIDDQELKDIDDLRYQQNIAGESKTKKFMSDAVQTAMGFVKSILNYTSFIPGGSKRVRTGPKQPTPIHLQAVNPTKVEWVSTEVHFNVLTKTPRHLTLKTDAPNGFPHPLISIDGDGSTSLEVKDITPVDDTNGRIHYLVNVRGGKAGWDGIITAQYDPVLKAEVLYDMIEEEAAIRTPRTPLKGTGTQTGMIDPTPHAITPESTAWKNLNFTMDDAYKVDVHGGDIDVYYSTVFPPYVSITEGLTDNEREYVDTQYAATLCVIAVLLLDAKATVGDLTPERQAERRAGAVALLISAVERLAMTGKKPKTVAAGA